MPLEWQRTALRLDRKPLPAKLHMRFPMRNAIKQVVRVKPGGIIELRAPELPEGARAEVIVLVESATAPEQRRERLDDILKRSQAVAQGRGLSDEEIAAEVAAWRAAQR